MILPSMPGTVLRRLPGNQELPTFDRGWLDPAGNVAPFLSFVEATHPVNWSEDLEHLHEEASRTHFIDVWTRRAMLERAGPLAQHAVVADLGCSTGYLLEDARLRWPNVTLLGADLVASGLRNAHVNVPDAQLVQADLCALPIEDCTVDAVLSANVLEHVPDDLAALAEIRRVLRPGARGVLVVPSAPDLYDYYDRFLDHERRYGARELRGKASGVGLEVLEDIYLGTVLYPAFWWVKRRNRRKYDHLRGPALEAQVARAIDSTRDSVAGRVACEIERRLLDRGVRIPFGIRNLIVVRRPLDGK